MAKLFWRFDLEFNALWYRIFVSEHGFHLFEWITRGIEDTFRNSWKNISFQLPYFSQFVSNCFVEDFSERINVWRRIPFVMFFHICMYHLISTSKNGTLSYILVSFENSMSFSFGFRHNLTNREKQQIWSFFLPYLRGSLLEKGWEMLVFGFLIIVRDFLVILYLVYCWILLALRSQSSMWFGGLRLFLRKLDYLFSKSFLVNTVIGLSEGGLCLLSVFVVWCFGWWRKILITYFGIVSLQGLSAALSFRSLVLALAVGGVLERQLRSSLFICLLVIREVLWWYVGVGSVIWGERNDRVFRCREKWHSEVWSLVRCYVSLWALVSKIFCNYSIGNILLS